jgi:hypothetical protein
MSDEELPISEYVKDARKKCEEFSLHPKHEPLGDGHHTDVPFTEEDERLGQAIAWFLGGLFIDVGGKDSRYWYYEMTSQDQWRRVARALRVHGLKITDQP